MGSVVTLDGILLKPHGEVSGGATSADTSTFSWEGQLSELPIEIERLAAMKAQLDTDQRSRRDVASANEAAAGSLSQRLERLRSQRSILQDELARVRSRVGQVRGEISWLVIAEKNSNHELEALQAEREDLSAERKRLHEEAGAADGAAAEHRKGNAAVAARREELIQAVAEASRQVAALEGEKRSLDSLSGSRQRTEERIDGQVKLRRQNSEHLKKEAAAIGVRLEENRASLAAAREHLATAEKELAPGRENVIRLDSQHRETETALGQSRSNLVLSERECLEAESQVQRRADELNNLRSALEADGMAVSRSGEIVPLGSDDVYEGWTPSSAARGASKVPPMSGAAEVEPEVLRSRIQKLRGEVRQLGPVNFEAQADYAESRERYDFLTAQVGDMDEAEKSLLDAIRELESQIEVSFQATFEQVNQSFAANFKSFFGGGDAHLVLTNPNEGEPGVDIMAQVPGRRLTSLTVLSGGERALTATALLFGLLEANPAPFCVLDEVDAALDEANVERFTAALADLGSRTQFLVITHNRKTIEKAGTIYGLSMGEDHASRVLSLRISDIPEN
ncbi:MAG: hypothetical protein GEU28_08100 [Dehalococcoidia bacterium]|nr:hypothetical protein [Dehalococcoidia bacterium]